MILTIVKCPRKSDEPFIQASVAFFVKWLFVNDPVVIKRWAAWAKGKTKHQLNHENLEIELTFQRGFLEKYGNWAECTPEDDEVRTAGFHRYKNFEIIVDSKLNLALTLRSIAHELVHIKQYSQGELKFSSRGVFYTNWKGKTYSDKAIDYFNYPWEIEALGRESGMVSRWLQSDIFKRDFAKSYTKRIKTGDDICF